MQADGYSLDDKRSPIADNDISDIIERFRNRDAELDRKRTDKSFMVPKQEIVDNDYDLSINKYKEEENVLEDVVASEENVDSGEDEVVSSSAEEEKEEEIVTGMEEEFGDKDSEEEEVQPEDN